MQSANKTSEIINAKIIGVNYFSHEGIQLTGGINFYNSDIFINDSQFQKSLAEDNINLVYSNFNILNSSFYDSSSDALDSDFSNGKIYNTSYNLILGDAIDTSFSKVNLKNIFIKNIADKGISVGENSKVIMDNITIDKSKIGIASKDNSEVKGENVKISNSLMYDIAAYNKKSIFNGGNINLNNITSEKKFLIQKNSNAVINSKEIISTNFNIESLY